MLPGVTSIWLLAALVADVFAHPGHDGTAEMKMRKRYMATLKNRGLEHCTVKLKQNKIEDQIVARRQAMVKHVRMTRGLDHHEGMLEKRDWDKVINSSHHSNATFTMSTPNWMIFGEKAAVLSPEVTEGPYYVEGEYIRSDVREKEPGVDIYVDIQMIDMNTCEPVKNIAMDFWHCNSTGIYGGIAGGLGNGNADDEDLINNKMLRGIQMSDKDGAVQFLSKFPGHYFGRTNHIHLMSHVNASIRANNKTITGGSVAHVGQLFFDQSLIDAVEQVAPYSSNKQAITKNVDDDIMYEGSSGASDPVVEYVLLGKKIEDGIFAWANFGIDPKQSRKVRPASLCGEGGCSSAPKMQCIPREMLEEFAEGKGKKGKGPSKKGKGKGMGPGPMGDMKGFPPQGMPPMVICGADGKLPPPGTASTIPSSFMGFPPLGSKSVGA